MPDRVRLNRDHIIGRGALAGNVPLKDTAVWGMLSTNGNKTIGRIHFVMHRACCQRGRDSILTFHPHIFLSIWDMC